MKIVIRTDASTDIGTGHVMRCLTLAEELREHGTDVLFICRELPGDLIGLIEAREFRVLRLADSLDASWQQDADRSINAIRTLNEAVSWLIVDHYGLDRRWEERLRPVVRKLMVIDDLADRPHDCDLLLDQNLQQDMTRRYRGLVPDRCRTLSGPQHALLRREFEEARKVLRDRNGTVRRILVFFGGSDPTAETLKTLEALRILDRPDIIADVVVGSSNPRKDEVRSRCADMPSVRYHCQVSDMAGLMAAADLSIGAGGSTHWERCYLGLPSVTIVVADNQRGPTEALAAAGAVKDLGWHEDIDAHVIADTLKTLIGDPAALRTMSERARAVMDGASGERDRTVVETILGTGNGKTQ